MGALNIIMHVYRVFKFSRHCGLVRRRVALGSLEEDGSLKRPRNRNAGSWQDPPTATISMTFRVACGRPLPSSESNAAGDPFRQRSGLPSGEHVPRFKRDSKGDADLRVSSCSVATVRAPHTAGKEPAGSVPPHPANAPDATNSRARAPRSASRRGALADFAIAGLRSGRPSIRPAKTIASWLRIPARPGAVATPAAAVPDRRRCRRDS